METFWQDLRYGLRVLIKQPGFAAVAVITLALGIGANSAIFSFVNSLFLRPLPVSNPDQVVRLYSKTSDGPQFSVFSYPNYVDLRDRSKSFADLAAHQYAMVTLNVGAGAENARGEVVTGNYFTLLGVNAAIGRTLSPEDDVSAGAHPVAVISHDLWRRRFGADPGAVGMKIAINGHPFTVIGVMPEKFRGTYDAFVSDFWAPMQMHEQVRTRGLPLDRREWGWLNGTGRLKPHVTLEQAQAEINVIAGQLEREYPRANQGMGFQIFPASALPEQYRQGATGILGFFMAVVGLVLLAACANIASILLSRMAARRHEIAIRQSLGATRGRLMRQLLTESLLLALLGGAAGLLVAGWVSEAMMALVPPDFAGFSPSLELDARILGFAFLVSVITGVLCGLLPALRAGGADVTTALKEESLTAAGNFHRSRLQQAFVIGQVAVSLVLLIVAGLLLRSLRESAAFHPGFNPDNLVLASVDLSRLKYPQAQGRSFYQQLTERLKTLPGVQEVTFAAVVPLGERREARGFRIPGHEPQSGKSTFSIDFNLVGPDYFIAMGIPLVRGRDFDRRDTEEGARPVVVINETMAERFWPGGDPVGQSMQVGTTGPMVEIVGVVRDIKYYSLGEEPLPFVYGSFAQTYLPDMVMHLRTAGDPEAIFRAVRKEVEDLDPNVAVTGLTTFAELRRVQLSPSRAMATVSGVFGLLTLILAAVGLYGVLSYSVNQRTREIGIRLALGAERRDVFRLVVGQGFRVTLIGLGVGLAASFALSRFLKSLLFGVSTTDPFTFASTTLLLTLVALLACYIPARRAMRVDPMVALRYE